MDFELDPPVYGDLDVRWIHGARSRRDDPGPALQVHAFDPHTYLLRQSKGTSYEAPFLYLLLGNDRAILFDTGATADPTAFPLRRTVDGILAAWLERHPRRDHHLIVAHTHAHGDHVAADAQFADRPDTTVVGTDLAAVQQFFGFGSWPDQVVRLDLGGRVLEVTGIPGHHPTSIAVFDPWSGFLLTGDTLYPGRLYAADMPAFVASMDRLVDLAATRPVRHVMGCHIEMTNVPGVDYPLGTGYQPDEPPLQLTVAQLMAAQRAAHRAAGRPGLHVFDDFHILNQSARWVLPAFIARTLGQRALRAASSAFGGRGSG